MARTFMYAVPAQTRASMIAGYTEAHFDLVLHQRKRRRSRAASGVTIPAVSQLPDHLCVNPKVSKRHLPDCERANCRL